MKSFYLFIKTGVIGILMLVMTVGCEKVPFDNNINEVVISKNEQQASFKTTLAIVNPGFESGFDDWTDVDPSAISGDSYSGSKSAKITGSGGMVSQTISVEPDKDYILSAYVLDSWTIGVSVDGNKISKSGNASDWEKVSVNFNSGSANSVTISAEYYNGTGRFDDFTITENNNTSTDNSSVLQVQTVTASGDDGNVPQNTLDNDLSTRWSSEGDGQWINYDLGSTNQLTEVLIAWYKGDERTASFDIYGGTDENNLSLIFSGQSSGNSLNLEAYDVTDIDARYVKIVGHGNSSNAWNSITEVQIKGNNASSGEEDTIPPQEVTNLSSSASNQSVYLSWNNPTDNDFDHVEISYNGGSAVTSAENITIDGLTNGTQYTFTVVAYDLSGNASNGVSIADTPEQATYPSDIISGLSHWKVTLPVDADGNDSSNETDYHDRNTNAWEVYDLINFEYSPYFEAVNDEVVFKAHCGGATTSGSKYPRSELRQLVGGGDNYWSVNDYQYLQVELRVTHTPVEKPEICMTQIHGPENEPLRLQYHANNGLYLVWNESNKIYFSDDVPYSLGQKLRVTVEVDNGDITCTVLNLDNNKSFSYTWTSNDDTGYFKVGCYTQSSMFLSQFKSGYDDETPDAYGEVRVSKIDLVENY